MRTNCRLCGYLCGLIAHVKNGQIIHVEPDPTRYPYDSKIMRRCPRSRHILTVLYHPRRLNFPLKRAGERGGGSWLRISWDQALTEIAEQLQNLKEQYGPETLATSIGGARTTYWALHRFLNLFGSPNNIGIGQICWNPSIWVNTLTYGWVLDNELDPQTTECALLWGTNPAESDNSLLWHTLLEFTRRGKKLIVVDPRRTRTARHACLHLPVRPGTDSALALAFLNVIINEGLFNEAFVREWCYGIEPLKERIQNYPPTTASEITGIPVSDIIQAARLFATCKPATIFSGRGIDQIGRNSIHTHRALAILRAITGNVDILGASHLTEMPQFIPEIDLELSDHLSMEQKRKQLGRESILLQTYSGYDLVTHLTTKVGKRLPMRYLTSAHPNLVWKAMIHGQPYPIRAMIVMASNPLLSHADTRLIYKALKSLDLLVVLDYFITPTGSLADYLLPIAGPLESPILQTNAGVTNFAYGGEAAVTPQYERRYDFDFCRELGIRLGQQEYWPWATLTECFEAILQPSGITWDAFCEGGLYTTPNSYRKYEKIDEKTGEPIGFATPSGKIELYSQVLAEFGYDPLPDYQSNQTHQGNTQDEPFPLVLISGARKQPYYASEFRMVEELRQSHPYPWAEMSADTAMQYQITEGEPIWVETQHGKALFWARFSDMLPGVVSVEYGWWYPELSQTEPSLHGVWLSNANILTSADIENCDPLLGQWCYNGIPCRIYKADNAQSLSMIGGNFPQNALRNHRE